MSASLSQPGKVSGSASASHLHYVLTQAGTAGAMRLFTFKAQWRDNKPAATGHQVTFTNCFVPTGSMPEITAGVQWDTIKMRLQSIEPKGTWATF